MSIYRYGVNRTINYENIILQHLNIYSVNVDNVCGDHIKVCIAIIIIKLF